MAEPPRKRRPVVAERRYSNPTKPSGKSPRGKRGRRAPVRRGNAITRGVSGFFSLIWKTIFRTVWFSALAVFLIIGVATFFYYSQLPEPSALFDGRARGGVTMLDREGEVFAWRGETFGSLSPDQISPSLRNAVVATEDRRFYSHLGIDPRGIAGAIRINLTEGRGPLEGNGGSTITQQVAKLLCLGESFDPTRWKDEAEYEADCRATTLWRKVKEVPFSFAMEIKYTKDEILNIYMNRSYLGGGARGFEAAAERYFNKHASDVSVAESAMLAGLLKAPSYFAPTSDIERAQDRAGVVLQLMHEQDRITNAEYEEARANPAVLSQAARARAGGYFADWLMESGPGFLTTETTEDVTILTTFDQEVQQAAERALKRIFDEKVREGSKAEAAVVVLSADGAVRAMIGGRDTVVQGVFNRATQAKRQTGSSFKPFVYAAALDQGMTPQDYVHDGPLTIRNWSPQNYTRRFYGDVTLTTALSRSLNTATIRLQEKAGRASVLRIAEEFGVGSDLPDVPSLGLGVFDSTLLEMTGAYAGIRNGGRAVRPYGVVELRVRGEDSPMIAKTGGMGQRVISQQAAAGLITMMREVIQNGTGGRAKLGERDAAGKTGTTSSYRDAWFIGFTDQFVTGVWMGYDDNTPLTGVTGGGLPAEIWQAVMSEISEGQPLQPLGRFVGDEGSRIGDGVAPSVRGDDALAGALSAALSNMQGGSAAAPPGQPLVAGSGEPLADALSQALGQPAQGNAPQTPERTVRSTDAGRGVSNAPETPENDPLSDILRGIDGLN
ncbi:transglycosylase domain-containing protein [Paracoccus aerodenitrificans]|uniref:transglycosylase domain-containing protein n=1 Tax=Paracoccus aerodenitrificans TaxID=3017781 RepID=UPI0022F0C771|nr:transglycosylase domain-containing protein [Paracoccus aerodenitrificans]WBU64346.1 transglycosylase domain-containing protein [Paracoccus aerodenitrificans]